MKSMRSCVKRNGWKIPYWSKYTRSIRLRTLIEVIISIILTCGLLYLTHGKTIFLDILSIITTSDQLDNDTYDALCPIVPELIPTDGLADISIFNTREYREKLQKIQETHDKIKTQISDNQIGMKNELLYDHSRFQEYLKRSFPRVFQEVKIEWIDTHGFIMLISGSDKSLKPLLLNTHRGYSVPDRVRVARMGNNPRDQASIDHNNNLIDILEALTVLFEQNFEPVRSVIVACSFEDETSQSISSKYLADHLLEKLGPNSIYALVSGVNSPTNQNVITYLRLGVSEKGYLHSSLVLSEAGPSTSIEQRKTIMSLLSTEISNLTFNAYLTRRNPVYDELKCLAIHRKFRGSLRRDILNMDENLDAKQRVLDVISQKNEFRDLLQTTQTVGEIEEVSSKKVRVNVFTRVSIDESIEQAQYHLTQLATEFAKKHDLLLDAYDQWYYMPPTGQFTGVLNITSIDELEPAPVTPTVGNPTYDILAGTIRHVYNGLHNQDEPILIIPSLTAGYSNTRSYWDLTDNIYRYDSIESGDKISTTDQQIQNIAFYYTLIRNFQARGKA